MNFDAFVSWIITRLVGCVSGFELFSNLASGSGGSFEGLYSGVFTAGWVDIEDQFCTNHSIFIYSLIVYGVLYLLCLLCSSRKRRFGARLLRSIGFAGLELAIFNFIGLVSTLFTFINNTWCFPGYYRLPNFSCTLRSYAYPFLIGLVAFLLIWWLLAGFREPDYNPVQPAGKDD